MKLLLIAGAFALAAFALALTAIMFDVGTAVYLATVMALTVLLGGVVRMAGLIDCAPAVALLLLMPHSAFAQSSPTTVDAGTLYAALLPYLASAVGAVISFLVGWVLVIAKDKLGISIDDSMRDSLQTAAKNAAGLVLNKLGNTLDGKSIDVKHAAIQEAVLYVVKNAPDALAHFGLSPDQIAEKILALLPQVASTGTPAAPNT